MSLESIINDLEQLGCELQDVRDNQVTTDTYSLMSDLEQVSLQVGEIRTTDVEDVADLADSIERELDSIIDNLRGSHYDE